ncbi:MAG TPA: 50S ribosomal protein L11 methyltransferase [Longimicrobium sp.]|uniref:50S ribosomal protein L11 methyltransferase n=1 Tax=Longimicrobium sp. TaxID=2029185 RepID=UPI002EDA69C2
MTDRWLVLVVRTADPDLLPLVAEVLAPYGGGAVLEAEGGLVAYAAEPGDVDAFVRELSERLRGELPAAAAPEVSWRWQENEDWARKWKEGLGPRQVTERIVVKPTWCEWDARPGQVVIDIDPQMAFGTGEHATTRGCLRLLDDVLRPGDRVVDVGSGSAILAIAAARLGAREVIAVEYDPDANLNARENLEGNGVEDRVEIVEQMADAALLDELGPFDLVLANILSGVIRPLLPAFHAALGGTPEGRLIVSGILRTESPLVVHDAEAAGFRVAEIDEEEEWWSALLRPA